MIAAAVMLSVWVRWIRPAGGRWPAVWCAVWLASALLGLAVLRPWLASWGSISALYVSVVGPASVAGVAAGAWIRRGKGEVRGEGRSVLGDIGTRFLRHRLAVSSSVVLALLVEAALVAGGIAAWLGVSSEATSLADRYGPYGWPNLLGTDDLGRDVFTRLLFGGQISLAVGVVAAVSSTVLGSTVGLLSGWYGGRIDGLLMRFTDAMLGIPVLPLMIVLSAIELTSVFGGGPSVSTAGLLVLGVVVVAAASSFFRSSAGQGRVEGVGRSALAGLVIALPLALGYLLLWQAMAGARLLEGNLASVVKIILIITLFGWMGVARLARAAALQVKALDFVTAARALGASDARLIVRHVLPHALAPILVAATLEVGGNILYEAALSFLGLGIQPPVPSWGNMLNNALDYIKREPLLAFWPGMLILTCVTCFNFIGDGLRDALDPHQVMKT